MECRRRARSYGSAASRRSDLDLFTSDFDFAKLGAKRRRAPLNDPAFENSPAVMHIRSRARATRHRRTGPSVRGHLPSRLRVALFRRTSSRSSAFRTSAACLYGPSGLRQDAIARQIGKVLNAREPKIVNGPEVLDKYVGGSEEKIRALFADAEEEQANAGDESMLHIVIFDEVRWRTMGGRDGAGC